MSHLSWVSSEQRWQLTERNVLTRRARQPVMRSGLVTKNVTAGLYPCLPECLQRPVN